MHFWSPLESNTAVKCGELSPIFQRAVWRTPSSAHAGQWGLSRESLAGLPPQRAFLLLRACPASLSRAVCHPPRCTTTDLSIWVCVWPGETLLWMMALHGVADANHVVTTLMANETLDNLLGLQHVEMHEFDRRVRQAITASPSCDERGVIEKIASARRRARGRTRTASLGGDGVAAV